MTRHPVNQSLLLTPPGTGAIGVVRVVGPDAVRIVERAFVPRSGPPLSKGRVDSLRYGRFVSTDEVVDDVIVSRISRGESSVVDISTHGGARVIERVLQSLEQLGAGLAGDDHLREPVWPATSFIEKEALSAVALAKAARAARFLAWQRTNLPAMLEQLASSCSSSPNEVQRSLESMVSRFPVAELLIAGATVAIVGPPNAGKSTLFNRLVGRSAAMVSPGVGTTRDWISASLDMNGVPITLLDTAGIGERADQLEQTAAETGLAKALEADLCLIVLDGSGKAPTDPGGSLAPYRESRRRLTAINKTDKQVIWNRSDLAGTHPGAGEVVEISAKSGAGLEELVERILAGLGFSEWSDFSPCLFTPRQAEIADRALSDLATDPARACLRIRRGLIEGADSVTCSPG